MQGMHKLRKGCGVGYLLKHTRRFAGVTGGIGIYVNIYIYIYIHNVSIYIYIAAISIYVCIERERHIYI